MSDAKCKVCGFSLGKRDHTRCVDPKIEVNLRATNWIELGEIVSHYFKIMEAVDDGGNHRTDSVRYAMLFRSIETRISEAVRESIERK